MLSDLCQGVRLIAEVGFVDRVDVVEMLVGLVS